jgi:hypothetical protein
LAIWPAPRGARRDRSHAWDGIDGTTIGLGIAASLLTIAAKEPAMNHLTPLLAATLINERRRQAATARRARTSTPARTTAARRRPWLRLRTPSSAAIQR